MQQFDLKFDFTAKCIKSRARTNFLDLSQNCWNLDSEFNSSSEHYFVGKMIKNQKKKKDFEE